MSHEMLMLKFTSFKYSIDFVKKNSRHVHEQKFDIAEYDYKLRKL